MLKAHFPWPERRSPPTPGRGRGFDCGLRTERPWRLGSGESGVRSNALFSEVLVWRVTVLEQIGFQG
jgi:hypothetical protein